MLSCPVTANTTLQALEPWQAPEFHAHIDAVRDHVLPWVTFVDRITDVDSARAFLQSYTERQAAGGGRIYGLLSGGTLVGGSLFRTFDATTGTCELGVWLAPQARGRGLVTRTAQLMIDWALDIRKMARVEWRVAPANKPSIAVAERLGMTRDGLLRDASLIHGVPATVEVWSLLARDPRNWL
jgi:RimJ/RimL family protein N-acetyltransferase